MAYPQQYLRQNVHTGTTGTTVDQHGLTRAPLQSADDTFPRGAGRERDRSRLLVRKIARLGRYNTRWNGIELGITPTERVIEDFRF